MVGKKFLTGLSLSWLGDKERKGSEIVSHLEDFDIEGIEINYRITKEAFNSLTKHIKKSELKVFSVHNFVPIPEGVPFFKAGGDVFNLASLDPYERKLAVKWSLKTIEHANDLDGAIVVVHCGKIDMDPEWKLIKSLYFGNDTNESDKTSFWKRKISERDNLRTKYLDALLISLDRLLNHAAKYQVMVAAENRYSYHELPQLEDFDVLFKEFKGAPLKYWHDIGHDIVNVAIGVSKYGEYIDRFIKKLAGFHVHDVKELDDHLPIGYGEIEFNNVLPLMESVPYIIELKAGTKEEQVRESVNQLNIILEQKAHEK